MTELEWCRANAPDGLKNESDDVLIKTMHNAYLEAQEQSTPMGNIDAVADALSGLEVAPIDPNEKLDEDKLQWYLKRFQQFKEDGVPAAVTAYVEHLQTEQINEITMATILQKACEYMSN